MKLPQFRSKFAWFILGMSLVTVLGAYVTTVMFDSAYFTASDTAVTLKGSLTNFAKLTTNAFQESGSYQPAAQTLTNLSNGIGTNLTTLLPSAVQAGQTNPSLYSLSLGNLTTTTQALYQTVPHIFTGTSWVGLPRLNSNQISSLMSGPFPSGSNYGGGLSLMVSNSNVSLGTNGRVFLMADNVSERFRQTGTITNFECLRNGTASGLTVSWYTLRASNSVYLVTGRHDFTYSGSGVDISNNTAGLTVQEGDYLAIGSTNMSIAVKTTIGTPTARYVDSAGMNLGDSDAFNVHTFNGFSMDAKAYLASPQVVYGGDSIMAGHNVGAYWVPFLETGGPTGTITSSISFQIYATNRYTYLNCGIGSQTWAGVVSLELPSMTNVTSLAWVIHCGINDLGAARPWADIEANLNTIKSALPGGTTLFIDEILPWTTGTDANALTLRTYNTNYATWCASNGAVLIKCHDAMGVIRLSTGEYDDMNPAYLYSDNIHLTQAGVNAMAGIIVTNLQNRVLGLQPVAGALLFNSDLNKGVMFDGTSWNALW